MSIIVEHEKRRHEILEKALDVFVDEGFEDVTFQKIADRCGITRTTLYIYFKNKKEIFNFSIKQLLQALEDDLNKIGEEKNLSCMDKLIQIVTVIINLLEKNSRLLSVVMNYLIYIAKSGYDPDYRLRRRTVRLRHIMTSTLIQGKKTGEFSPSINVKEANELLYGLIESAAFRLTILHRSSIDEIKAALELAVKRFAR